MKRSVPNFDNDTSFILKREKPEISYKEIYAPVSYSAAKEYKSARTGAS